MNDCPSAISGTLEISYEYERVLIAGDPLAFRELARLFSWMADADQDECDTMPDGERLHVHFYPGRQTTKFSNDVEISRIDAKGTGELPPKYGADGGGAAK